VKDAAQGVAEDVVEDVPQDVAQDLAFEARAVRALLTVQSQTPQPSWRSSRLAEMGAQLGSSQLAVAFDSGCGQAPPGWCRAKRLNVYWGEI